MSKTLIVLYFVRSPYILRSSLTIEQRGNEMIAPLDVCTSRERRLPVTEKTLPLKTFARQSFASHGKDVYPSRRLPVTVKTFARQSFARQPVT